MITVEFEQDHLLTTILDPEGIHEDLQIYYTDEEVYLRQWCDVMEEYHTITITETTYNLLLQAYNLPEGVYLTK